MSGKLETGSMDFGSYRGLKGLGPQPRRAAGAQG